VKDIARHIFDHAMRESSVPQAFARNVHCERGVLRICEDLYDLHSYDRVLVMAMGKAAHSMLTVLHEQAGGRFEGIVASPVEPEFHIRGFRYFHGGHPLPNAESIRAAGAMLKSAGSLTPASLIVYLISGGGSACCEKSIDDQISLEDLAHTYRALVHSSLPISEINAIRKHLSAIKAGRLAQAAYPSRQVSILVSDVPDSTPDALASGPTMPDSTSVEGCYRVTESETGQSELLRQFPASVRALFDRRALAETPKSDDPAFVRSRWWTVLSNAALLDAARKEAERQGFTVTIDNSCDDWDYRKAGDYLLERLRELRRENDRVCLLSGGEVIVHVESGGVGGRNQQLALYIAGRIGGENVTVLSAGSDGIDGNSNAAGATVDGTTTARAKARGLDAIAHLRDFNAEPFFEALGDAIITGPTGNNLRDIRVLLAG
jgi:glycerate 2-kinase